MERKKWFAMTMIVIGTILTVWIFPANAGYYDGKTISVILPYPGGSGLDVTFRELLPYWQKHMPGNPKMIVKNMPGGGGIKALNFLYQKAKPDGLTLAYGAWHALGILTGHKGIRWVPEKFEFIGTGAPYFATYIRTDIGPGIKRASDIMKVDNILMGGRRASADTDVFGLIGFELIGAKYRFISGYKGMAKLYPAMLRNEIHATNGTHNAYYIFYKDTMVKEGKAMPLWYHAKFDISGNPEKGCNNAFSSDVQSFLEVYKEVHGKMPSGVEWEAYKLISKITAASTTAFAPPGTPKEAVGELRKAFQAAVHDPGYAKPFEEKYGSGRIWLSTEHGLNILNSFRNVSPEALAWMKKIMNIGK